MWLLKCLVLCRLDMGLVGEYLVVVYGEGLVGDLFGLG